MKNKGKSAQNMRRTKGENYAENIGFGVVKFMQFRRCKIPAFDCNLYLDVWDCRRYFTHVCPGVLHLQYFVGNAFRDCSDFNQYSHTWKPGAGRWNSVGSDRRIPGWIWKLTVVSVWAAAVGVMFFRAFSSKEEKEER